MRHFDMIRWVDYARGLISDEERSRMEAHLQEGCADCAATLALFERIANTAKSEDNVAPPADLVQAAVRIFPAWSAGEGGLLRRLGAKLVFDGFARMQPAGARSSSAAAHLMFEAEDYCVDLREEGEQNSTRCSLVGQIMRRSAPLEQVAEVPVLLLAGEAVVAQAISNQFGEFCLEYVPQNKLRLAIPIEEAGVRIEVSLNKFTGRE